MSSNRQLFLQHVGQTSDFPMALEIVRGEGNYLIDKNGKKYLDLISGISVSAFGHGHPAIVNAVQQQAAENMHVMVYGEFVLSPQVQLATKLATVLPKNLSSVFFVNSGSEAIEGAMKLVKRFTGRTKIISFHNSYHGSSHGALSLGGNENQRNAFRPLLPEMIRLRYNEFSDLDQITAETAAVFIEPIQAEAGVIVPDTNYLKELRKKCTETGTLLVFDEIQTGFGRGGKLFAFEHFGVVPDVLVLAKGFGAGMPLGAFISSVEIMKSLRNDPVLGHITTFGGHPVSCAASLAGLDLLVQTDLLSLVSSKEKKFIDGFRSNKKIKSYRSYGLMGAVQLDNFDQVQKVIADCIEQGLITDWFLYNDSAIRISAPLTITNDEIDFAITTLNNSISNL